MYIQEIQDFLDKKESKAQKELMEIQDPEEILVIEDQED